MEWQGGNKQRPNYWQWHRSFILGDLNWKFVQVGYPVNMYLSPNWMLSSVQSVKHFFRNALSRAHRGVLVPTSLWLGPIDSLPLSFSGFIFKRKSLERKLLCQLFTATNCSTLARHALKFARLLLIQFCSSRYWAMRISCLVVTSRRSRDRNPGFSAGDDAAAQSVMFIFIQINTFMYLRKMSICQTNSVYVTLYLYSTM